MTTLADGLLAEQQRCRVLLEVYAGIGPAGAFGAAMIRQDLADAEAAIMSGDVVAMLRAYEALRECQ